MKDQKRKPLIIGGTGHKFTGTGNRFSPKWDESNKCSHQSKNDTKLIQAPRAISGSEPKEESKRVYFIKQAVLGFIFALSISMVIYEITK